jgi:hypothetical protein
MIFFGTWIKRWQRVQRNLISNYSPSNRGAVCLKLWLLVANIDRSQTRG